MFAKLFVPDDDQVLVMLDTNEDGEPYVSVSIRPQGFGVCSTGISFKDDDAGEESARKVFQGIDEETARKLANEIRTYTNTIDTTN